MCVSYASSSLSHFYSHGYIRANAQPDHAAGRAICRVLYNPALILSQHVGQSHVHDLQSREHWERGFQADEGNHFRIFRVMQHVD